MEGWARAHTGEVATAEGQKEAEEIKKQMEIRCQERRVKVDQMANTVVLDSEATLARATNDAKSLIAQAEAENNSTAGLEVKRRYELEWERLEVMEGLAANLPRVLYVHGTGQEVIRAEAMR